MKWLRNATLIGVAGSLALCAAVGSGSVSFSMTAAAVPFAGGLQPRAFAALLGRGDVSDAATRARTLRETSERHLAGALEDRDAGDGAKDDFQSDGRHDLPPELAEAVRNVSLPGGGGTIFTPHAIPGDLAEAPDATKPRKAAAQRQLNGFGVPVGAIGTSLVRPALGLRVDEDDLGSVPDEPGDEQPPVVIDVPAAPGVPEGEVPLPGALLLFPAGAVLLLRSRRR